VHVYDWSYA